MPTTPRLALALSQNDGSYNIATGTNAGSALSQGSNYNIDIGSPGTAGDANTIRIGDPTNHTKAFIAGIFGATVTGSPVMVDPTTGQLGVASSSARYKQGIQDVADSSDALMQLRPVSFHYKQGQEMGPDRCNMASIAEEVAKIYPELVVYRKDGQAESVQYTELLALLLNELQKEHRRIEEQKQQISQEKIEVRQLRKAIALIQAALGRR